MVLIGVGVDVSVRRGLDLVALDGQRRLVEAPLARQTPDDLEAVIRRLEPDAVAIDSPPAWGLRGTSRRAERELIALGLPCFRTPSDPALREHPFYRWMFAGHAAFAAAGRAGYPPFRGGADGRSRALEVFPHGAAVALAGVRPPPGTARNPAAKRRWREAVLVTAGVDVASLPTLDAVDAALAALVAVIVAEGGPWFSLGEPDEGCVVLPGRRPAGPYRRSEPESGAGTVLGAGPVEAPQHRGDHPGGDRLQQEGHHGGAGAVPAGVGRPE